MSEVGWACGEGRWWWWGVYIYIENADATPSHLEVTLRLVGLMGCRFFAGLCIWVVQLIFVNCTCTPAWNVDMLKVSWFCCSWEALIGCKILCIFLHWDFRFSIPVGFNLYKFGRLLDVFWIPFGCLLDTFWMPFGSQDVPGVHFCEFVNFNDFWSATATKKPSTFNQQSIILTTWWG